MSIYIMMYIIVCLWLYTNYIVYRKSICEYKMYDTNANKC